MADTFHPFSRLPMELRLKIWTQALRPRNPGVHFFWLHRVRDTRGTAESKSHQFARPLARGPHYGGFGINLGAPSIPLPLDARLNLVDEEEASWTRNNPSTYLIDGGLWTACKESRQVMEGEYQMESWNAAREGRQRTRNSGHVLYDDPRGLWFYHGKEKTPSTGHFVNKDSTVHHFSVLPDRDLFFFQARNFDVELITKIQHAGLWSNNAGHHAVKNIAIAYDPTWWAEVKDKRGDQQHDFDSLLGKFALQASFAKTFKTVWFVDYSLKRKFDGSTRRTDREVFEGVGCRFVQVYENDEEFESETGSKSLPFCKTVDDAARWEQDSINAADGWLMNGQRASYGVLACEYF